MEQAGVGDAFVSFLILLVISVVVSGILHYGAKYYVTPGHWSFVSKVAFGWGGAALGTPVFGKWFPAISYGGIDIIAAIVGCIAFLVVLIDIFKTYVDAVGGAKAT